MKNLPDGWELAKLAQTVNYKKGNKPQNLFIYKKQNTIPYIDIKAFEKDEIDRYAEITQSRLTQKGNILVVWDGARSGLVGKVKYTGAIGSTLTDMEPIIVETDYLYRFLQTQYNYINSNPRGTGIPHVDPAIFWNIEVPLPPLNEQKRIVSKLEKLLSRVESAKELLDKIPNILTRFKQSILAQACSGDLTKDWREKNPDIDDAVKILKKIEVGKDKYYENECQRALKFGFKKPNKPKEILKEFNKYDLEALPEKWVYCCFSKIIYDFKYGSSEKSDYNFKGLAVIRIPNILSGVVNLKDLKYLNSEDVTDNNKVKEGDILIVRSNGSRDLVAKSAIVRNISQEIAFASYLIRIRPILILPEFVMILLNSSNIKEQFFSKAKSSAGINNINTEELSTTIIPLPPLEEQEEIVNRVNKLFIKVDRIEERYLKAKSFIDKLDQSILSKAFRGELIPQDPNDEPASVLLEKIKAEKAKFEGSKNKVIQKQDILLYKISKMELISMKKSLIEVLKENPNGLIPEELFNKADYAAIEFDDNDILKFYRELSALIQKKLVIEEKIDQYKTLVKLKK